MQIQHSQITKIVFLASGNGSNCEAIWNHLAQKNLSYQGLLICNKPDAYVIQRAQNQQIPHQVISDKLFTHPQEYHVALLQALLKFAPDYIICAGYLKLLPASIIKQFPQKIINIHPSLLPSFKGLHAIKQAWEYPVKITGITIHLVNEELDAGQVLLQKSLEVMTNESLEALTERIHQLEHQWYPKFVSDWCFKKNARP